MSAKVRRSQQEPAVDFPLGPHEPLRLRALTELDVAKSIPSSTVDRITAFARDHFKVSICLVNLIEADRALVLSGQELDASEVPRKLTFCTYTILQPEVLVVPDARLDERFNHNLLVTGELFIRFYAGTPLAYEGRFALARYACSIPSLARSRAAIRRRCRCWPTMLRE
jgi:GAF domain-containing protein